MQFIFGSSLRERYSTLQLIVNIIMIMDLDNAMSTNSEYLLRNYVLPSNLNFMPSLSNGHLGYTVFGNAIHMNGVYNGCGGDSHRARIPNWINLSVVNVKVNQVTMEAVPKVVYELNLRDGYFRWTENFGDFSVEQRSYAHRYFNRALIYELIVRRNNTKAPLTIMLAQTPGEPTDDFVFEKLERAEAPKLLKGTTIAVENEMFQKYQTEIFVAFSEDFRAEKQLDIPVDQAEFRYRFLMAADQNMTVALKEINDVLSIDFDEVLSSHASQWNQFWDSFNIKVTGNLDLSQIINCGIFYMANSLPSLRSNQPPNDFYGLSPTGLARGCLEDDYQGHNFWDTEIWMLPVITQLSTEWADIIFQYRLKHLNAAVFNANISGQRGARFPWESAFTGTEVTNPNYPEVAEFQIHITPDIGFALQQHYALTNDNEWLCQVAWPIMQEIAKFLESRVAFTATTQQFHINNVMGPDEDHCNINDSVYTNVVSKMALEFAAFTQNLCDPSNLHNSSATWLNIAKNMRIVYDTVADYHPEFCGYQPGETVKQADVVLLGYPLQYKMNSSTRRNDLTAYEKVTRSTGPAMTWSMFALNSLDLGAIEEAQDYFQRSYKSYVEGSWKIWNESKLPEQGAVNFLTGVGGFLQAIINGYAGVRFYREDAKSFMRLKSVNILPGTSSFSIKGLKFAGAQFNLQIQSEGEAVVECVKMGSKLLHLIKNGKQTPIESGLKGYPYHHIVMFQRTDSVKISGTLKLSPKWQGITASGLYKIYAQMY